MAINNSRQKIDGVQYKKVYTPYITRKGKRIYHPKGKLYVFWVKVDNAHKSAA